MSEAPDFEALRQKRNTAVRAHFEELVKELGGKPEECTHNFNFNSCYCDCPDGPCEHKWDGPDWESEDGCAMSVTCSRCGCTAMSHDMRVLP